MSINFNKTYTKFNLLMIVFLVFSAFIGAYATKNFILYKSHAKSIYLFGKSIELNYDQTSPSYIEVDQSQNLNAKKDFTAEAWIKPSQAEINSYIFSKSSGSENGFNLGIFTSKIAENQYNVEYRFSVADANLSYHAMRNIMMQYQYTGEQVTSWHHIAGVIQSDGKMDIFVDGERSTMNFNSISNIWSNAIPVTIGARQLNESSVDGYFPGLIDEVRISSVSRYPENFIIPSSPFTTDASTDLLLNLNDNVFDASGNNRNGIVNGSIRYIDSNIVPLAKVRPTKKPKPTIQP